MHVNLNPTLNFKQKYPTLQSMQGDVKSAPEQAIEAPAVVAQPEVLVKAEGKKLRKASGIRQAISNISKFFASISEMTKASFKALFYGATTSLAFLAGFWAFGSLPNAVKNGGDALKDIFKHPLNNISKKGKIITGVAASGVMAYHILKGWLNMNKRTADIEHKWKTDHRDA